MTAKHLQRRESHKQCASNEPLNNNQEQRVQSWEHSSESEINELLSNHYGEGRSQNPESHVSIASLRIVR